MNNPGNFAAALQTIMNGVGLVTQTGHATPPVGTVVIYNDGGTLKYMGSDGVPHTFGGGGGGGVENPMTSDLNAAGNDITGIGDLSASGQVSLPLTTSIDGKTPATLEGVNQNFDGDVTFDQQVGVDGVLTAWSGIAMFGGTAGQFGAIADASGGIVEDTEARTAINSLLAALRTRGDLAT